MCRLLLIPAIFALILLNYGWANNLPTLTKIDTSPQPVLISSSISESINSPNHIQGTSCEKVLVRTLGRTQNKLDNSLTESQKRFLETAFDVRPQPAFISSPISVSININSSKYIQGISCEKVFARALDRAQRKLSNSLTEAQKRFLETDFSQ